VAKPLSASLCLTSLLSGHTDDREKLSSIMLQFIYLKRDLNVERRDLLVSLIWLKIRAQNPPLFPFAFSSILDSGLWIATEKHNLLKKIKTPLVWTDLNTRAFFSFPQIIFVLRCFGTFLL
jgi:hypothetical protein